MQAMEETEIQDLEDGCGNISLEEEEEKGIDLPEVAEDQSVNIDLQHAMVGRFLTDKHIKFEYMQQVLASVWRPVMGMRVKEIRANLFIFQFFHEKDLIRVLEKGPWGLKITLWSVSGWEWMISQIKSRCSLLISGLRFSTYLVDICQKRLQV